MRQLTVSPETFWSLTSQLLFLSADAFGTMSFLVMHWLCFTGGIAKGMPSIFMFMVTSQLPSSMLGAALASGGAASAADRQQRVRLLRGLMASFPGIVGEGGNSAILPPATGKGEQDVPASQRAACSASGFRGGPAVVLGVARVRTGTGLRVYRHRRHQEKDERSRCRDQELRGRNAKDSRADAEATHGAPRRPGEA